MVIKSTLIAAMLSWSYVDSAKAEVFAAQARVVSELQTFGSGDFRTNFCGVTLHDENVHGRVDRPIVHFELLWIHAFPTGKKPSG